jgi:hypothetical protein
MGELTHRFGELKEFVRNRFRGNQDERTEASTRTNSGDCFTCWVGDIAFAVWWPTSLPSLPPSEGDIADATKTGPNRKEPPSPWQPNRRREAATVRLFM